MEWKERIGYNNRWMVEIIIVSFKGLLGEAVRAMKSEYIMIEIATKIACMTKPETLYARPRGEAEGVTYALLGRTEPRPAQSGIHMAARLPRLR